MLESFIADIAYKCDQCGELFTSPEDAQYHNQKAHNESLPKDEFGSWIIGISTPAGDSEQEKAM